MKLRTNRNFRVIFIQFLKKIIDFFLLAELAYVLRKFMRMCFIIHHIKKNFHKKLSYILLKLKSYGNQFSLNSETQCIL